MVLTAAALVNSPKLEMRLYASVGNTKKERVRGGHHEGWREERQDADKPKERLPAHVRVDHRVRVDESEHDRGRGREQGELDRVAQRADPGALLKVLNVAAGPRCQNDLKLRVHNE